MLPLRAPISSAEKAYYVRLSVAETTLSVFEPASMIVRCHSRRGEYRALSIAGSHMCMTLVFGTVSGAHFNRAVTVAVVASYRSMCSMQEGLQLRLAQLLAGFAASRTGGAIAGRNVGSLKPACSE